MISVSATVLVAITSVILVSELALVLGAVSIIASIVGMFFIKLGKNNNIMGALYSGLVVAGVLGKIEIWPKELYELNLRNLLEGKDEELNLASITEEAFSLLNEKSEKSF